MAFVRKPMDSTPLPLTTVQERSSLSASTTRAPMKRTKSASVLPSAAFMLRSRNGRGTA